MDSVRVISPNGQAGSVPAEQLQSALAQGFKLETNSPPPVPESNGLIEGAKNIVSGVPGVLANLGIGAAKGVGDAVLGAGQMVHKLPGVTKAVDALYGAPGLSERAFKEGHSEMAPTGTAQGVGKFGANVGMMALSPSSSIPAAMAGNALLTGAQTGGNIPAMLTSGALGGVAQGAGAAMRAGGRAIQKTEAGTVAGQMMADDASKFGYSTNTPHFIEKLGQAKESFANMIQKYGLTGGKADVAKILAAPQGLHEELSALSQQLGKARPWSHLWSLLSAGSMAAGAMNPANLLVAGPLAAQSIISRYPGASANILQKVASPFSRIASALGSGVTNEFNRPQ